MKDLVKISSLFLVLILCSHCTTRNEDDIVSTVQSDCDTLDVKYSTNIKALMSNNCALSGCHIAPGAQSGIDYSVYGDVRASAISGSLMGRITGETGQRMRPGGPYLSDCEERQIELWILDGAPNN